MAFFETLVRVFEGFPRAEIPDHHGAAAVLAFGDRPLEIAILDRMIFHLNGKPLVRRLIARTFGDGPALEDAVPCETEIIMEVRGGVLLNDEGKLAGMSGCVDCSRGSAWFSGDVEVPH